MIIVVNGKQLEDRTFSIPAGAEPPKNLSGKLFLLKAYLGFWFQPQNKISNLNIFSKQMTLPEMVSRTAGEDCSKSGGDYLDWKKARWDLKGKASPSEANVGICRRESKIQVFTSTGQMDQCKNLCNKIQSGTMATVRSRTELQKMFDRVDDVLYTRGEETQAGRLGLAAWAPLLRTSNGSWVDLYNKDLVTDIVWAKGNPQDQPCAIYVAPWKGLGSYSCEVNTKIVFISCPCLFPQPRI